MKAAAATPSAQSMDLVLALTELVQICVDGERGYAAAAKVAEGDELRQLLLHNAVQRADFVTDLRRELERLGAAADLEGTTLGALHRGWIDVRRAIAGGGDEQVLDECARGDASAVRAYEKIAHRVLWTGRPETRALVEGQRAKIQESHDELHRRLAHTRGPSWSESHAPRTRALSYVQNHHCMSLATIGPEGPWASSVMYVSDGFVFYFLSAPESRHGTNLSADPRVALTINEDYAAFADIKGIQLEGAVDKVTDVGMRAYVFARFLGRFPFLRGMLDGDAADLARQGKHVVYRVRPRHVHFVDNERSPGVRVEVDAHDTAEER